MTLSVFRLAYGAVLLLAPPSRPAAVARQPLGAGAVRVARVLGARHVAQGVLLVTRPTRTRRLAGVVLDVLHGASMLALAVVDPRRRALATADAAVAGLLAVGTVTATATN